jgi:anti-anti-sigma factor
VNSVVVVLAGEYDVALKQQLRADLDRLVDVPNVILDCSAVTYVDSTIIAELISLHRLRAENRYERETIVLNHRHVVKLFDLLDLKKVFRIVDRLDDEHREGCENAEVHYAVRGRASPDFLSSDGQDRTG